MKQQPIPHTPYSVSRLIFGCMHMGGSWSAGEPDEETIQRGLEAVEAALEAGITIYDHADIYCRGRSERVFAEVWKRGVARREDLVVQSKCGIRFADDPAPGVPGRYDFSREYILASVDGILKRLETDYLDILLLHRPDPLAEPEEVAEAFATLQAAGKVKHFGVSNHTPAQLSLLRKHLGQPLVANQIQINLLFPNAVDGGIVAGYAETGVATRGEGVLEYCREHEIAVQAYAPLAQGRYTGKAADEADERTRAVTVLVAALAERHGVSREAIALAWLTRHPAKIQPVIGTLNPGRIQACAEVDKVELSREEWNALFIAGRGRKLP
ncbi:MAG: aldo/keto reductase [Puniceicoccaceae bacterium]|nr:MAG: aldo/keto reductase [Puniceicoccaceae bacterium]